ncbi:MAG: hypothetical protein ACJ0SL_06845 [Candidatus Rariloculaceae bacterium]
MMAAKYTASCVALATVFASMFASSAYGQADLEGIWTPNNPPGALLHPMLDEVNLTPAGRAELEAFTTDDDPAFRCIMPGIPKGFTDPYPMEIIQQEHQIVFLAEYFHQVRRIYMDGREPPEFWPPTLAGYSNGHWEGETLVVRTAHITGDNITDPRGLPFSGSEDAYVIERYRREGDELKLAVEVHDPINFDGPYLLSRSWEFTPDGEIWEYDCNSEYGIVN